MTKIEFVEYTNEVQYWLFCNVYLCIHQQKQILAQNNTQKTVVKVKNLLTEVKPSYVYLCDCQ